MKNRVLVTGVNGFAGRYLSPHLAAHGYEVIGTSHIRGEKTEGTSEIHQVDLRSFDQISRLIRDVKPTHVVHLAAISFVAHEDVSEIYGTNVVGTRNLLKALASQEGPPQAVVLTSSANVYGNSDKGTVSENDPIGPVNDYAVSKVAMELMSRQFSAKLKMVIARPFNYTGRGQASNFLVPKIVEHMKSGADFIELGNTDIARDFSDVRTVVQYLRLLMESPVAAGQVYNICTGRPYSLGHIIETCEDICRRQIKVVVNPDFVRQNEIKLLVGDPSKLFADVGKINSYSLRETLDWMLAN